jgi:hypothetical protein
MPVRQIDLHIEESYWYWLPTGSSAAQFAIVPAGWNGSLPENVQVRSHHTLHPRNNNMGVPAGWNGSLPENVQVRSHHTLHPRNNNMGVPACWNGGLFKDV